MSGTEPEPRRFWSTSVMVTNGLGSARFCRQVPSAKRYEEEAGSVQRMSSASKESNRDWETSSRSRDCYRIEKGTRTRSRSREGYRERKHFKRETRTSSGEREKSRREGRSRTRSRSRDKSSSRSTRRDSTKKSEEPQKPGQKHLVTSQRFRWCNTPTFCQSQSQLMQSNIAN